MSKHRVGRPKRTKAARACLAQRIRKHCRKKNCERIEPRRQAIAIAFSQCRRLGFKV
jgi:hypothetical protein